MGIVNWIKGLSGSTESAKARAHPIQALPASVHKINVDNINAFALSVIKKIIKDGYEAYFVGGSVRDLMLSRVPKDYDIATNATPEQIRSLFKYSRIIGRRFKLVHVYGRGESAIEVSTFRASIERTASMSAQSEEGVLMSDNVYGGLEEDAWRRDFTINAFYYNPIKNEVLDIVGGLSDLQRGSINSIGEPKVRLREDPIRVLRALRFSAKLDFSIEKKLKKVIGHSFSLLAHVPGSRLYDAFCQIFFAGYAKSMYHKLKEYEYFSCLFPEASQCLQSEVYAMQLKLLIIALESTDLRYQQGKYLNPGFLLAIILWAPLQAHLEKRLEKGVKFFHALHQSIEDVVKDHSASILILPGKTIAMLRDMWLMQYYLQQRRPSRIEWLASHRYFRAAYDMLEMREQSGETKLTDVVVWWRQYQHRPEPAQQKMIEKLTHRRSDNRRRPKKR